MIFYNEVDWSAPGIKQNRIDNGIEGGKPLAFIIGDTVVETMATDRWFSDLMETVEEFLESSAEVEEGSFAVDLIKNGSIVETLVCSEKIWAILLSNPIVVGFTPERYKYAEFVNPGWKYINNQFVIPGEFE
jgi:hypothetical protein